MLRFAVGSSSDSGRPTVKTLAEHHRVTPQRKQNSGSRFIVSQGEKKLAFVTTYEMTDAAKNTVEICQIFRIEITLTIP